MTGKYSSEIRPAFFLAIPYMLVPCWAGMRVFSQSRAPTSCNPDVVSALPPDSSLCQHASVSPIRVPSGPKHALFGRIPVAIRKEGMSLYQVCWIPDFSHCLSPVGQVQEEHRKGLLRRPVDLALVIYLTLAAFFTLFRGLVSLQWPAFLLPPAPYPVPSQTVFLYPVQKGQLLSRLITRESSSESELSVPRQSPTLYNLPSQSGKPRMGEARARGTGLAWEAGESFLGEECFPVGCSFVCLPQVVLDCPTDACFTYIYQYEPYLRDPVAYPKVQVRGQMGGEGHTVLPWVEVCQVLFEAGATNPSPCTVLPGRLAGLVS